MNRSPVLIKMTASDTYDFTLLSVISALLEEVYVRCGTQKREGRIEAMQKALHTLQETYKGYIADDYMDIAKEFLFDLHKNMDALIAEIKEK